MSKTVYVGLAALAVWGAGANTYAASPTVAAEYRLWGPGGNFVTDVTTSPNGLAVFKWITFVNEPFPGRVAVMKNAGEPYVKYGVTTAALNGDWSKIAIGRELHVSDPREVEREFVDDVEKAAREIGVQPEEVAAAIYGDGFVGIALVSRPVIVDLETRAETPLAVAGSDFLYWLNDDELIIGRMVWGEEGGSMEAIKYDVRNGERETFASEDLPPLLNQRTTHGPPYISEDWRLLPAACESGGYIGKPAPPVAVPSRGGQFQNDEGVIYWLPAANGPAVEVAAGNALAASDDGVWLYVSRQDLTRDSVWPEGFYALRLAWQ